MAIYHSPKHYGGMAWKRNDNKKKQQNQAFFGKKYCKSYFLLCFLDFSYEIALGCRRYLRKLDKSCIFYNIYWKQLFISYAPVLRKFNWGILATWEFSFPFPQFNTVFCLNPRNLHIFQFKYTHFTCSKINKLIHKILHTSAQVFTFCCSIRSGMEPTKAFTLGNFSCSCSTGLLWTLKKR